MTTDLVPAVATFDVRPDAEFRTSVQLRQAYLAKSCVDGSDDVSRAIETTCEGVRVGGRFLMECPRGELTSGMKRLSAWGGR